MYSKYYENIAIISTKFQKISADGYLIKSDKIHRESVELLKMY